MPRNHWTAETIADEYRQLILSGELEPGSKLPSNKELAGQKQVAGATITRAMTALAEEGYVRTSPRGTFVADDPKVTYSARDRLERMRHTRSILAKGETSRVTAAELIRPPVYVADILALDEGEQVVRREYIAGRGQSRTLFGVAWFPGRFAGLVPDLLNIRPSLNATMTARVLDVTERSISHWRDDMHARRATQREASALGLPTGEPVLAGVYRWSDEGGPIEYGEFVLPPKFTIGYESRD